MSKSKKMREHATELADRLAPHVESAREKAGPMIADARSKAAPVVADAKGKLSNDVMPVIAAAVAAAGEATKEARGEAKKRGRATAAALKGEVAAPKKKHRLRKLVGLMGLAGIGGMIAKHFSDRQASTAWQSSYQPTPATPSPARRFADETPTGAHAATSDDEGAAAPDEAAADAAETPHAVTTPDDPAEEIKLDKKD